MSVIILFTTIGFLLLVPATIVNPAPDHPGQHASPHPHLIASNSKDNKTSSLSEDRLDHHPTWSPSSQPPSPSSATLTPILSTTYGGHSMTSANTIVNHNGFRSRDGLVVHIPPPPSSPSSSALQELGKAPRAESIKSSSSSRNSSNNFRETITEVKRSADEFEFQLESPDPPLSLASSSSSSSSSSRNTGPYFDSNKTTVHITARAGQTVLFDCAVILLQGRTVSWLRRHKDKLQLLTVGNATYYSDSRVGLRFRYPNNWRLGIETVQKRDEGEYQCQLSTHPPKALIFHLKVIAPAVLILDENGHVVTERHYKVDSSLHLTCKASHVDKLLDNIIWLKGESRLPGGDSRIKVKLTKNQTGGEATSFLSVLSVRKTDSGNYSCVASTATRTSIQIHVLNGELPAAVQHENGGSGLLVVGGGGPKTWSSVVTVVLVLPILISLLFPTLHMPTFFHCLSSTFSSSS